MLNGWMDIATAPRDRDIMLWPHADLAVKGPVVGRYRKNTLYGDTWDFEDGCSCPLEGMVAWQEVLKGPAEE